MKRNDHSAFKLWFDRLLSRSLLQQLLVLSAALLIALGLSYLFLSWSGAEWLEFCERKDINQWLLPLYLLIDSNALNNLYLADHVNGEEAVHGWMLIASSITFLIGAFIFNGIIISIITTSIERRVENYKEGHTNYLKSGHHVIMGYDEMATSVISHIFQTDKDAYILILSSAPAEEIREKLLKSFSEKQMERILIKYGHRVAIDIYDDLHIEHAKQIYVVGNHGKSAHDAINVECVDCICNYLGRPDINDKPKRITCFFKDIDTYSAFKTSDIFSRVRELGIEFVPYNLYAGWAKQIFVKRTYNDFDNPGNTYSYPSVYGTGISPEEDLFVHLVFIGTSSFSLAFAIEAAHLLHFPNYKKRKTLITFIDKNMEEEKEAFIIRNHHLFEVEPYIYQNLRNGSKRPEPKLITDYVCFNGENAGFLDIQFEFINGDVFSKPVQDLIRTWAIQHHEGRQYLSIFLAQEDQRQNFLLGMNMPDEVYDYGVNLFIRQDRSDNFVTNLRNADKDKIYVYSYIDPNGELKNEERPGRYSNIYPFGMNETAFCVDNLFLKRAKLINYLYSTADYDTYKFTDIPALDSMTEDEIWEEAERFWRELPVALQWSNLYSAYSIRVKVDTLRKLRGLAINDASRDNEPLSEHEVDILAEMEHNRWNVEKLLMGFRKARKCEDKYLHPKHNNELGRNKKHFIHHDIRNYDDLDEISGLDKEFSRYIPWILKLTGY